MARRLPQLETRERDTMVLPRQDYVPGELRPASLRSGRGRSRLGLVLVPAAALLVAAVTIPAVWLITQQRPTGTAPAPSRVAIEVPRSPATEPRPVRPAEPLRPATPVPTVQASPSPAPAPAPAPAPTPAATAVVAPPILVDPPATATLQAAPVMQPDRPPPVPATAPALQAPQQPPQQVARRPVDPAPLAETETEEPAEGNSLVDLNTASADVLNGLGAGRIGRRIVENRPYAKPDDLIAKRVLTRKDYDAIKPKIGVR